MLWGLGQADVVKISDNEVKFLFGLSPREGAAYIRGRFGTQLVFVTCGADGCEFASLRAQGHVDGLKGLTVTDTTGAGDIFGGCAVWRLLQSGKAPAALDEAELRGIAEFACRVAGRSTEKSGGISAITEMPGRGLYGVMGAAQSPTPAWITLPMFHRCATCLGRREALLGRFVGGVDGVRAAVKAVYIDAPALFVLYGADAAAMGTDVQIDFINRVHRDLSFSLLMAV